MERSGFNSRLQKLMTYLPTYNAELDLRISTLAKRRSEGKALRGKVLDQCLLGK